MVIIVLLTSLSDSPELSTWRQQAIVVSEIKVDFASDSFFFFQFVFKFRIYGLFAWDVRFVV